MSVYFYWSGENRKIQIRLCPEFIYYRIMRILTILLFRDKTTTWFQFVCRYSSFCNDYDLFLRSGQLRRPSSERVSRDINRSKYDLRDRASKLRTFKLRTIIRFSSFFQRLRLGDASNCSDWFRKVDSFPATGGSDKINDSAPPSAPQRSRRSRCVYRICTLIEAASG